MSRPRQAARPPILVKRAHVHLLPAEEAHGDGQEHEVNASSIRMSQRIHHRPRASTTMARMPLARYLRGIAFTTGWIQAGALFMGKKMPPRNIIGICITCIRAWATSMFLETAAMANPRLTKQPAPMRPARPRRAVSR